VRRFRPGERIVLREMWHGRIWTARPVVTVRDADDGQMFFMAPGVAWKHPRGRDGEWLRLPNGDWTLDDRIQDEGILSFAWPGVAHAVLLFFDPGNGELLRWYINLQEPVRRTAIGFDYLDHVLDIVVAPDLSSWKLKDKDELDEAVRRGIFTVAQATAIREESERAFRRFLNRASPFDRDWSTWRPDPGWPIPELPPGWDAV
jgi:hypothetical protein